MAKEIATQPEYNHPPTLDLLSTGIVLSVYDAIFGGLFIALTLGSPTLIGLGLVSGIIIVPIAILALRDAWLLLTNDTPKEITRSRHHQLYNALIAFHCLPRWMSPRAKLLVLGGIGACGLTIALITPIAHVAIGVLLGAIGIHGLPMLLSVPLAGIIVGTLTSLLLGVKLGVDATQAQASKALGHISTTFVPTKPTQIDPHSKQTTHTPTARNNTTASNEGKQTWRFWPPQQASTTPPTTLPTKPTTETPAIQ